MRACRALEDRGVLGDAGEEGADGEVHERGEEGEEAGEMAIYSYDGTSSMRGKVNPWNEGDVGSSGTANSFANMIVSIVSVEFGGGGGVVVMWGGE